MGQGDVLECLKKNGGWMSAADIAFEIKLRPDTVRISLKKLYYARFIMREIEKKTYGRLFHCKAK